MNSIKEIAAAQQAASDFATSLRSAHVTIALEGRSAPSFIRAAGVLEQASAAIGLLLAMREELEVKLAAKGEVTGEMLAETKAMFARWPCGLEEIEASLDSWRRVAMPAAALHKFVEGIARDPDEHPELRQKARDALAAAPEEKP